MKSFLFLLMRYWVEDRAQFLAGNPQCFPKEDWRTHETCCHPQSNRFDLACFVPDVNSSLEQIVGLLGGPENCCWGTSILESLPQMHFDGRSKDQPKDALPDTMGRPPCVPPFCEYQCLGPGRSFYTSEIGLADWPAPRKCGDHFLHHIGYSIPVQVMVECLSPKLIDFASVVPTDTLTYAFDPSSAGEMGYLYMYRSSWFSHSIQKGGWESMRMVEIMASGSIPLVHNMSWDGRNEQQSLFPFWNHRLHFLAQKMPGLENNMTSIDRTTFSPSLYISIASEMLRHARHRLTTHQVAKYILSRTGNVNAKRVLYFANCNHGNYLCYQVLHGFKYLFQMANSADAGDGRVADRVVLDFPRLDVLYATSFAESDMVSADNQLWSAKFNEAATQPRLVKCRQDLCLQMTPGGYRLVGSDQPSYPYGHGYSYAHRIPDVGSHANRSAQFVSDSIQNTAFDVVIYGSPVDGLPFLDQVHAHYDRSKVIFIHGKDPTLPPRFPSDIAKWVEIGHVFVREMPEGCPVDF